MLKKEDAIRINKVKGKSTTYTFNCLDCGIEINLQSGSFKTHSGKCRRCVQKGIPYAHIYNELSRSHSNHRGIEVTMTLEEFLDIIAIHKCHYCEDDVIFHKHSRDSEGNHLSRAYQLDRKENSIGYTKDNCVVCCWECNRLKSDRFTYDEFILLSPALKQIMNNRK